MGRGVLFILFFFATGTQITVNILQRFVNENLDNRVSFAVDMLEM